MKKYFLIPIFIGLLVTSAFSGPIIQSGPGYGPGDEDTIAAAISAGALADDSVQMADIDWTLEADDLELSGSTLQLVAEIPHTDVLNSWTEVQGYSSDKGFFFGASDQFLVQYDSSDDEWQVKAPVDSGANTDEALDASETEITVDDSSLLAANEIIKIDSEYMTVSSIDDGTTITVVRGALDSTEATHANPSDIYWMKQMLGINNSGDLTGSAVALPTINLLDSNMPDSADQIAGYFQADYQTGASGSEDTQVKIMARYGGANKMVFQENEDVWDGVDGTFGTSPVIVGTTDAGATSARGQALRQVSSDGEYESADANLGTCGAGAEDCFPAQVVAINGGVGSGKQYIISGKICETDWNWGTIGGTIYLSEDPSTDEGLTQTAPSDSGDCVQTLGYAYSADCIVFNIQPVCDSIVP